MGIGPNPEETANAAEHLEILKSMSSTYESLLSVARQVGDVETANKLTSALQASEEKKIEDSINAQIDGLEKYQKMGDKQKKLLKDEAKAYAKKVTDQKKLNDFAKKALETERRKLGLLKEELKTERKITEEAKRQAKEEKQQKDLAAANIAAGHIRKVGQVAGQMENITGASARSGIGAAGSGVGAGIGMVVGGPAGAAIGSAIGDVISGIFMALFGMVDKYRVEGAKLAKAMSGSGQLVEGAQGIESFKDSMVNLRASAERVGGMSIDMLNDKMQELASAGISMSGSFEETVDKTRALNNMANNLGTTVGQLGTTLVGLRRSVSGANDEQKTSEKIALTAREMVRNDIMQQGEWVQTLSATADEFSELNVSFEDTSEFLRDLTLNIDELGTNAKVTREITNQLTKSFKATGDEWKSFIGMKSGFGGGFLGGLFGAQQRGPGGDLLTRKVDPRVWLEQVQNTIQSQTAGFADPRAKMYMAETLGKQMGLDPKATQALLKGVTGNAADQANALEEMAAAAEEAEEKSRDWAERLADLLQKWVYEPLNEIRNFLKIFTGGGTTAEKAGAAKKALDSRAGTGVAAAATVMAPVAAPLIWAAKYGAGKVLEAVSGGSGAGTAGKAAGTAGMGLPDTGLVLAHRGEEILDPIKGQNYRKGKSAGAGGINLNVTVNAGGSNKVMLDKAFDQAKQETYRQLKKNNTYAWGM